MPNPANHEARLARRADLVQPFTVMELSERAFTLARQGKRVVHFQVGEPDFSTCAPIVHAGRAALDDGHTHYTDACGLPELREAISAWYESALGVDIPAEAILVTPGASGGLTLLLAALFDPGAELLMADPGYPCNAAFAHVVNAVPRLLPAAAAAQYQPLAADVKRHWAPATRGVLLASPANPTGGMLTRQALLAMTDVIRAQGGLLLLDEIYTGLSFADLDGVAGPGYRCGWEVDRGMFLINSFSKYFGMTGWRLGWLVAPEWARSALKRLAQNLFIAPSTVAQHAALAAFQPAAMAEHERRRRVFHARRDLLAGGLRQLGFDVPLVPGGGFFLYVNVSQTGLDAETFCWRLLEEFNVAVTPGSDFGSHEAAQHVRFAFTTDEASIELGLERIRQALAAWS